MTTNVEAGRESIRAVVAKRLGVTLDAADYRLANQRALDVVGDVVAELDEVLRDAERQAADPVRDVRAFAATLATRACRDVKRSGSRVWRRTSDTLRYVLSHSPRLGFWRSANGTPVGGLFEWKIAEDIDHLAPLSSAGATRRCDDPASMGVGPLPAAGIDELRAEDWDRVLDRLFARVGRPIPLVDLVRMMLALFGVGGSEREDKQSLSIDMREALGALWREVAGLDPRQRAAWILRPPGDADLTGFVAHGVASCDEIGRVLAMSPEQYERAWRLVLVSDEDERSARTAATDEARFAVLWPFLPLSDGVIADALGVRSTDPANLRMAARRTCHTGLVARGYA